MFVFSAAAAARGGGDVGLRESRTRHERPAESRSVRRIQQDGRHRTVRRSAEDASIRCACPGCLGGGGRTGTSSTSDLMFLFFFVASGLSGTWCWPSLWSCRRSCSTSPQEATAFPSEEWPTSTSRSPRSRSRPTGRLPKDQERGVSIS